MSVFKSILAGLAITVFSIAHSSTLTGYQAGNAFTPLLPGQAATKSKAFDVNFFQPGGGSGSVIANTSTFTGQPAYSVPIFTLNARNKVSFPVGLSFSGPTFPTMENNNDLAPVGWIGLGWSFDVPYVAVNHKGTFTYSDDVVMCDLGQFGGGQILREPETGHYFVSSAPSIQVKADTVSNPSSPLFHQIEAWIFTMPGGTRMIFGDTSGAEQGSVSPSERIVQYSHGTIIASPYNADSSKPFIYRWDVRRIEDNTGKTGIDFDYQKEQESLWHGLSYDRESHIKDAIWKDEFGDTIQRVHFTTEDLDSGEYSGYLPSEAKTSQKIFEKKHLVSISVYNEDNLYSQYALSTGFANAGYGAKRILTGVQPYYTGNNLVGHPWTFTYDSSHSDLLQDIELPSGTIEHYDYDSLDLSETQGAQDANTYTFTRSSGSEVATDAESALPPSWTVESPCDDRFCYEIIRDSSISSSPANDSVYVRVTSNPGNYFSTEHPVFQITLADGATHAKHWQVIPMGDYFLTASGDSGATNLYEWNGKTFNRINDQIDSNTDDPDPLHPNGGTIGTIEVSTAGNYFLIHKTDFPQRIWVYLKDPGTGKWKNLTMGNRDDETCELDNPILSGIEPRRFGYCFDWVETNNVNIATNNNMFIVTFHDFGVHTNSVLYAYALNQNGDGFDLISNRFKNLGDGSQNSDGAVDTEQCHCNWSRNIVQTLMGTDYFILKSDSLVQDVMFFDGDSIGRVAQIDDQNLGTSQLWLSDNYFIHANLKTSGKIEYWRKKTDGSSNVFFEKDATLRNDLSSDASMDLNVAVSDKYISVEYYPDESFMYGRPSIEFPSRDGSDNYQTWLYRINASGNIDTIPSAGYSYPWSGVCSTRAWDMSFSSTEGLLTANVTKDPGAGCNCTGSTCSLQRVSFKLNSDSNDFVKNVVPMPNFNGAYVNHLGWSFSSRLGQATFINSNSGTYATQHRIVTRRSFFNGKTFGPDIPATVVDSFTTYSGIDDAPDQVTQFHYGDDPGNGEEGTVTEFNHNTFTPQFEHVRVTQSGLPGSTEYNSFVDYEGQQLIRDSASLSGQVHSVVVRNGSGDTMSLQFTQHDPSYVRGYNSDGSRNGSVGNPWPQGLAVNRITRVTTREYAGNGSFRTSEDSMLVYNDSLEVPLFTKSNQGTSWKVSQQILDPQSTRVMRNLSYDYATSSHPNGPSLSATSSPLSTNPDDSEYVVSSSRVGYNDTATFEVDTTFGWRDVDETFDNDSLMAGAIPKLNPVESVFVASIVSKRNKLGQPIETSSETALGIKKYSSIFYEGRASLPVATIANAPRDNVAVMTAENGNVPDLFGEGYLDWDRLWYPNDITYSTEQAHTGRYSLKVTSNNYAHTIIYLKNATHENFDYVVSGWIYCVSDGEPILSVTRRHANGSSGGEFIADPVGEAFQPGKWQRWEVTIPHNDLVADGMFADESGDYLQILVGTVDVYYGPNPDAVIYVDDIVARPSNAPFSLTAYNEAGQPMQTTDANHRITTYEYGFAGQPIGTRDQDGRVMSQSGSNRLHENSGD